MLTVTKSYNLLRKFANKMYAIFYAVFNEKEFIMPKIIITILIILLCLSRTTSYAIYAFREKNIIAGVGA